MPTALRCMECNSEMTLTPLGPIEGEEHGVHMKIDGMPAMQCPQGHTRFVAPAFPMKLLDELLSAPLVALDAASEKGFLKRRYCCPACGHTLDAQDAERIEVDRSLEFDGLSRFGVHVDMLAYRCPQCQHECVEPSDTMFNDLMKASAHAYRAAHIAPG